MPLISEAHLTRFAASLLAAGGVDQEEAALVATSLVAANLRGHDSHGVMRIPFYLAQCAKGEVTPGVELSIVNETASVLVADGNWGFGQTQAQRLTRRLVEKAESGGAAVGTLVRSGHVGRLGEYCEMAAAAGMVSMMMANTHGHARRVPPPGGKAPRLGTNPIAFGVPRGAAPLVLDFGTSATAEGKVRVRHIAGQKCPDGWLLDSEGRPTNDPGVLYREPAGTILPMGGDQAYKGFGLALVIEVFTGALSGGPCVRAVPTGRNGNCVFMLVANPARMGGVDHLAREVHDLAEFVLSCPTIDGAGEILLPGDPERRTLAARRSGGIPMDDGNWHELVKLATRLGVELPSVTCESTIGTTGVGNQF